MIEVQLHGSHEARWGNYSYSHPRKDPVGPLLRKMIQDGAAKETDVVSVLRGSTKCFNDTTIAGWSDWTISDRDKGGIHRTRYVPFNREV